MGQFRLGRFNFNTFVWALPLRNVILDLSLRVFAGEGSLDPFHLDLSFGNFRVGFFAWELPLGIFRLGPLAW